MNDDTRRFNTLNPTRSDAVRYAILAYELRPMARLLLLHLLWSECYQTHHDASQQLPWGRITVPSDKTLAQDLGINESTVQTHLGTLRSRGVLVEVESRHTYRQGVYELDLEALRRLNIPF